MQGELSSLNGLHSLVTEANAKFGFIPEARPYAPHITLARKYLEAEGLREGLLNKDLHFGDWTNDTIMLYRTKVTVSPMYEVIGTVSLQT
ncbi:RNA 2',3'-cyclic phosphodiesterase [compost metagenome]